MKKLLLISGALLALCASSAFAAGQIHLAIGDCGGAGTISNTCLNNSGNNILVISMVSPIPSTQVIGFEAIVDIAQGGALSDWWRFDAAGCRNGRLSSNSDFSIAITVCADPFASAGIGGQGISYPGVGSGLVPANSERVDVYAAVDATTPMSIDNVTEASLFHIVIGHQASTGTGSCGGCATPTSLYLNDVLIGQEPGVGDVHSSGDGSGQGCSYNGGNTPTPTKSSSWGSIKALYR
jgi:hypothetical protein